MKYYTQNKLFHKYVTCACECVGIMVCTYSGVKCAFWKKVIRYGIYFSIEFGKIVCLIVIQISKDDGTYTYIAICKLLVVI